MSLFNVVERNFFSDMLDINIFQTFTNVLDIDFNHLVLESTTDIIKKCIAMKILTIDHDYEMQKET